MNTINSELLLLKENVGIKEKQKSTLMKCSTYKIHTKNVALFHRKNVEEKLKR